MSKLLKWVVAAIGGLCVVIIILMAIFGQDRNTAYVPNNSPAVNSNIGVNSSNDEEDKSAITYINEGLENDKDLLTQVWETTLTFIDSTNQDIMEYMNNDDAIGLIAYSKGIINSKDDLKVISDNLTRIRGLIQTDEGIEALDNIENTFNDYMVLIKRFSVGDFSEETISMIGSVTDSIETINIEIIDFLSKK